MARVNTYLNFPGNTGEAFEFYKSVFKTEYVGPVMRMKDGPPCPEAPPLTEATKNLIMHVALPILGGHILMGTDGSEMMGIKLVAGNNFHISLEPDTRAEADRLFAALSAGGKVDMPMAEMFWGGYFGDCVDKFGTKWMINCMSKT